MIRHTLFTWLLTCFIGTLLLCVVTGLSEEGVSRDYYPIIALIGFGVSLIASIPAMVLYGVLAGNLRRMPVRSVRGISSGYAVLATMLSFLIIAGARSGYGSMMDSAEGLLLVAPYTAAFILAIWILPIPEPQQAIEIQESESIQDAFDRRPLFPEAAFYTIAAVAGLETCYSIRNVFSSAIHDYYNGSHTVMTVIHSGLQIAGVVFFLRKRPMGWKLLVFLFISGVASSLIGLAGIIRSLHLLQGAQMARFFVPVMVFIGLDVLCMVLLMRPAMQAHYRVSEQDRITCLLAGAAYGCLYMIVMSLWR